MSRKTGKSGKPLMSSSEVFAPLPGYPISSKAPNPVRSSKPKRGVCKPLVQVPSSCLNDVILEENSERCPHLITVSLTCFG